MGFLNLSSWRSAGGRVRAERSSGVVQVPPSRYYYEQLPAFQGMVDGYAELLGRRPSSVDHLYLWVLDTEGHTHDARRGLDLADWMSYFEIEPHSLLAIVNVVADRAAVARRLHAAREDAVAKGAVA